MAWGVFIWLNRAAEELEPEAMQQAKQEDKKMEQGIGKGQVNAKEEPNAEHPAIYDLPVPDLSQGLSTAIPTTSPGCVA